MEKVNTLSFYSVKNVCLFILLTFGNVLIGQGILSNEKQSLFDHMNEINKEWSNQDIDRPSFAKNISFPSDRFRIQMHLFLVENILRERIVSNLTSNQRNNRNHFLDVLKGYAAKGVFPQNINHQTRQPYFVDHLETACAVGHLIQKSGAHDLVEKIKKENNFAYLSQLEQEYPEIDSWANENGFTTQELAWIQPGYPPADQSFSEIGNGGGVDGKLNVMKTSEDGSLLYLAGDFSQVDGVDANSIIAWDGENWLTLGDGVEGEILTIAIHDQDKIYIGGNFILNGNEEFSNIAYWNGITWEGLQKGEMNGVVYSLLLKDDNLIAGGDFQNIDNISIKYLAKISNTPNSSWNNHAKKYNSNTSSYDYIVDAFAVNGPVRSLVNKNGILVVGGDFTETAPDISDSNVNSILTKNISYWISNDWSIGFDDALESIETIFFGSDGKLYTAGSLDYENDLGILEGGGFDYQMFQQLDANNGENRFHGFVEHNGVIYGYGDISPYIALIWSSGFIWVGGDYDGGSGQWDGLGALFDKSVRAAEVFQEDIYFGGDFTSISSSSTNSEFNGLAKSPFMSGTNSVGEGIFVKNKIQIFNTENQLNIQYENLEKNSTLNLFNLQGQLLKSINLPQGSQELEIGLSQWSAGMYVYQILNEDGKQAGKFHVN